MPWLMKFAPFDVSPQELKKPTLAANSILIKALD
jgi:hypothetical protein